MKSRLLSRSELEELALIDTLSGQLNALSETSYEPAVETALSRADGFAAVSEALQIERDAILAKIMRLYGGRENELISLWLQGYDIHNFRAVLRGISRRAPTEDIARSFYPFFELSRGVLMELASAEDEDALIDLLATMNLPQAAPLLDLLAERPDAATVEMELALELWRDQMLREELSNRGPDASTLLAAHDLETDIKNLLMALRLAHSAVDPLQLLTKFGFDEFEALFLGPGEIPVNRLIQLALSDSVQDGLPALPQGSYRRTLEGVNAEYEQTGRLSVFELQLKRCYLESMARYFITEPLGIGVVLAYLALKINEIRNISHIAHGTYLGISPDEIIDDLRNI
jgi:vacuolar-type H+-ATPase subunit C/Vma6